MKKIILGLITALLVDTFSVYSQASSHMQTEPISAKAVSVNEQKEIGEIASKFGKTFQIAIFGYATKDTSCIVLKGIFIVGFSLADDTIYIPERNQTCEYAIGSLERRIAGALCYSGQLTSLSVGDVFKISRLLARLTLADWIQHKKYSYYFSSGGVLRVTNADESKLFAKYFGFK